MSEFSIWVEVEDVDDKPYRSYVQTSPIEEFSGLVRDGASILAIVSGTEYEILNFDETFNEVNFSADLIDKTFLTLRSAISKKVKQFRSVSYDLTFLRVIDLNDLAGKIAAGLIEKENHQALSEKFSKEESDA
jgi:hypothetical protein